MADSPVTAFVRRALGRSAGAAPPAAAPGETAASRAQLDELKALRKLVEQVLKRVERIEQSTQAIEKTPRTKDALTAEVRGGFSRMGDRVDALIEHEKMARKSRSNISRQVTSLVRAQYLAPRLAAPEALLARRFRLHSQHEEDGIVLALLEAAGVTGRRFLEIGSGSSGGNSGVLAFEMGWSGLMVEVRSEHAARLRAKLTHNPKVAVADVMVTSANVNDLVRAHGLAGEIDLLSLDIDSTDYWVFEALEACSPRVAVIEYNALFGPERAVTIPDAPRPAGAPGVYSGASLAAFEKLARRKGYGLVLCEDSGVNAFFLRDGLAPDIPRLSAAEAYRPQQLATTDVERQPADVLGELADRDLPLVEV